MITSPTFWVDSRIILVLLLPWLLNFAPFYMLLRRLLSDIGTGFGLNTTPFLLCKLFKVWVRTPDVLLIGGRIACSKVKIFLAPVHTFFAKAIKLLMPWLAIGKAWLPFFSHWWDSPPSFISSLIDRDKSFPYQRIVFM